MSNSRESLAASDVSVPDIAGITEALRISSWGKRK